MHRTGRWWRGRRDRVRSYEARVRSAVTMMLVPLSCSAIMVMVALFQVGAAHGRVATELDEELDTLSALRSNLTRAGHLVEDYASGTNPDAKADYRRLALAIDRDLQLAVEFDEAEEVRLATAAKVAWVAGQDDVDAVFAASTRTGLLQAAHDVDSQFALAARWIADVDAISRAEVQATSESSARTSRLVIALAVVIGAVVTCVNMALIRRFLKATFGPLRHLKDSVRGFTAEDLTRRIELTGDREFRAVAESFNLMADRLSDTFESLEHQAFHDALTGLPNRAGLLRHLRSDTTGDRSIVLFDLDDFKEVNDGLGHAAGDEALHHLARRLTQSVRQGDLVARLGGDEFVVVLDGVTPHDAVAIGEALAREISRPFVIGGRQVVLHASGGIAPVGAGDRPIDAVRLADVALYAAKAAGKQCVRVFNDDMLRGVEAHLQMATDLRQALARGEIAVHYQPTVSTVTGAVHGVEALLRWTHPGRGVVPPSTFIPVAEVTGEILALGRYVLETACRQARAWQQLPGLEHLCVNVNVSAVQLQTSEIVADVARALQASGLAAASLTIEVTESVVACPDAVAMVHELKALGVGIALDDFGTGYSSLSYLQRLPIDVLKIDKSFIDDIDLRADRAVLASSIVRLGQSLGMVTVAEGVERPDQLRALGSAGCDVIQGYLFARPQPAEAAEQRLRELTRSAATTLAPAAQRWVRVSAGPLDIVGARDWLDHAHWALDEIEAGRLVQDGVSPSVVALMRDFVHRWSLAALDRDEFVWVADEDPELLGILMSHWHRVSRALVDAVAAGTITISTPAAAFSQALVHAILVALAEHEAGGHPGPAVLAQRWPNRAPSDTSTGAT